MYLTILCFNSAHAQLWEKSAVFLCLWLYLPEEDPLEDETRRRITSDKWLFITDRANCCIICSVIGLAQGVWLISSITKSCRILHEMPLGGTDVKLMAGTNASRSKGPAQVAALGTWRETGWKAASCHNQPVTFRLHLPSHITTV